MSIDDILFEPINLNKSELLVDQQLIDAVKIALTGTSAIEFYVDPDTSIETYDLIADLVEKDQQIIKYTDQMVKRVSASETRPIGALTIKDVFRRLHAGDDHFYFSAKANGLGVLKYNFTNWFGIDSQIPILHVDPSSGAGGIFEWWIMGLMTNNIGYNQYYCFGDWSDASKYYGVP